MEEFITIKEEAKTEIIIKKSKFIAEVFYVESQKEAEEKIQEVVRREHSAKHHCYAYCVWEESLIQRMSDDGEPSGTAGNPMLTILQGKELVNVLVVVTRYFGGILLGTGGLVRAYSEVTAEALEKAATKKKQKGVEISFQIEYSDFENVKYYLKQAKGTIKTAEYGKKIQLMIQLPKEKVEEFTNNYGKLPFQLENVKIIEEKFVDI